MSILGYSSSYFLPQYWSNTPLYGEKILPLIDYILSNDYEYSDNLAQAFYAIEDKYKNTQDLLIEYIEEIIDENGYSYVKDLLGNNEDSIRLLVVLVGLVHQLKGTKLGIQVVLNLLKRDNNVMTMQVIGEPTITSTRYISNISESDYVVYKGFVATGESVEVSLSFGVKDFKNAQTVASTNNYGFSIGVNTDRQLTLNLGSDRTSWNIGHNLRSDKILSPGTEYYIRLLYDGYEYALQVSTDGKKYETWISRESKESLNIYKGSLYLGVDASEGIIRNPLNGYINFSNFTIGTSNTEITQWFEQTPVGPENTFMIKTDLDVELISSDFFEKFSEFIKNYVYPTLTAFEANLRLKASVTVLPFARQKITYNAFADLVGRGNYLVKTTEQSTEATDPFIVETDEPFMVITK